MTAQFSTSQIATSKPQHIVNQFMRLQRDLLASSAIGWEESLHTGQGGFCTRDPRQKPKENLHTG